MESEWNAGRPRHRVICNLGRKALLAPHTDSLLRLLQGKQTSPVAQPAATAVEAWDWGVMLVARHFRQQQGVDEIVDLLVPKRGRGQELADRAL